MDLENIHDVVPTLVRMLTQPQPLTKDADGNLSSSVPQGTVMPALSPSEVQLQEAAAALLANLVSRRKGHLSQVC